MQISNSTNPANVKHSTTLVVTKPPKGKVVVHTELGVTEQNNPDTFLEGFDPEVCAKFKHRTIKLVPIESVGLEWRHDGKTDAAFTQSGIRKGYKVLVSTSQTQKLEPGFYIQLDKKGDKVLTRVFPEGEDPERENKVFISPKIVELKPGLYTYLDKNGNKVLVRDLPPED